MDLNVVILAAGKGTRMKSNLPKVLQPLAKKPLLAHVLETSKNIQAQKIIVVYGYGGDQVKESITAQFPDTPIEWVEQTEQLGTGHAVQQALPYLETNTRSLILYGDVPLISEDSLNRFLNEVQPGECGVLTVKLGNPAGYGRIVRDHSGTVREIVEEKDAGKEIRKIEEVNTGILLADSKDLQEWLPTLTNNNTQREYYLTDLIRIANDHEVPVIGCRVKNQLEVEGVNDKIQLAKLERMYQHDLANKLMVQGATLTDPSRLDIRGTVKVGKDCLIEANVVFEGKVILGDGVNIEPNCILIDCEVGNHSVVKANSIIQEAIVEESCEIGPYARLRPGTIMRAKSKIGNFVETKKSTLGSGSKANHLSYLGDSEIGENVNIGAGTITCNYDGVNKHRTLIGDGAFIGSNSSLVAPIDIGENATIGAGSTVSRKAEKDKLTITRAKQTTIDGWKRPNKKS